MFASSFEICTETRSEPWIQINHCRDSVADKPVFPECAWLLAHVSTHFMWLTRDRLNSTQKTAFKWWPRCGLSIEPFHFMNFFLRWRDHSCQKKKEKKNMDDISGGIYIPCSLRFVVRFQFFTVSWINPTKEVFIRIDFVKIISLHPFSCLADFSLSDWFGCVKAAKANQTCEGKYHKHLGEADFYTNVALFSSLMCNMCFFLFSWNSLPPSQLGHTAEVT